MLPRCIVGILLCVIATDGSADPVRVALPGFQCTGMAQSVRLPSKLSQLRQLGRVTHEQVVHTQEWDGYKAVEKLIRFEGMRLRVVTFTNDPEKYSLSGAYIESSAWNLSPFPIGQPIRAAVSRLGVTNPASNAVWQFSGESESLYLESRKGKVFRVVYECYTG